MQAASPFYKTFSIDCSKAQISVDMFLFSSTYQDVASLGKVVPSHNSDFILMVDDFSACLPHYTSGQTYYYPAFNAARAEDAIKFAREFGDVMAMPIMVDCITRVRASRGMFSLQYTYVSFKYSKQARRTDSRGGGKLGRERGAVIYGPRSTSHVPSSVACVQCSFI